MLIYVVKCDACSFHVDTGTGGVMYVTDDSGKRIGCAQPGEISTVAAVLGERARDEQLRRERTGFLQVWVCLDCLSMFLLDLDRDERKCGFCASLHGSSAKEMIDKTCPKCKKGFIRLEDTGCII